ncbi:MAG: prepilin-type N-terminal cleavage/methylation domain-containing protein [Actinomycetota bacterium]
METDVHHIVPRRPARRLSDPTPLAHRRPRPSAGFTLTEVLTAVALTGVLVLAIVLAAFTLVRASGVSDRQANVEAALGGAADELAQFGWTPCPEEATTSYLDVVRQAAERVEWPASAMAIERIAYWDISSDSWSTANPFGSGADCEMNPTISAASRMQLVTVRATAPGDSQSRTLDVVVADIALLENQSGT